MPIVIHAHWIANNICSNCKQSITGWAIQQGYTECPNCHAIMDEDSFYSFEERLKRMSLKEEK